MELVPLKIYSLHIRSFEDCCMKSMSKILADNTSNLSVQSKKSISSRILVYMSLYNRYHMQSVLFQRAISPHIDLWTIFVLRT